MRKILFSLIICVSFNLYSQKICLTGSYNLFGTSYRTKIEEISDRSLIYTQEIYDLKVCKFKLTPYNDEMFKCKKISGECGDRTAFVKFSEGLFGIPMITMTILEYDEFDGKLIEYDSQSFISCPK